MKNNKNIIIGAVVVVVILLIVVMALRKDSGDPSLKNQEVAMGAPVDVANDYYKQWRDAVNATNTDPYGAELTSVGILSEGLRTRLGETQGTSGVDPVICQTPAPERTTARIVAEGEDWVRVLILGKDTSLTAQSIFVLGGHKDGWYIKDIECSAGEFAPEREFTFDQEGFLLKSVPAPFVAGNWHLVFEENGEPGHVVPLLFGANSTCISTDGSETVCAPDQIVEPVKAHVYGQMTELGAEVTRIEFVAE